jgi:beta-glucosidase
MPELPDDAPFRDPSLAPDERAADLVDRLTLDERIAQLGSVLAEDCMEDGTFSPAAAREELEHGIGHVTRIGDRTDLSPPEIARFANDLQAFLREETRAGIPAIAHDEALCGYLGPGGTVFPQAINQAATWNPDAVRRMTGAIADQFRAVGSTQALSPVLDIARDPRWGRLEETFGEDPHLATAIGRGFVAGLGHGGPPVAATVKHCSGHGHPTNGKNRAAPATDGRGLRGDHHHPFRELAGEVESVMAAYHANDGVPCHADAGLLADALRDDWGFDGSVVSDYFGVEWLETDHAIAANPREAGALGVSAGVDVELPRTECYGDRLAAVVEAGDVDEATIDRAARRVLRTKFRLGLFAGRSADPDAASPLATDGHREVARDVARQSIVIARTGHVLPLDDPGSIAVVGPKADAPRGLLGDYSYPLRVDRGPSGVTTPLDGLRNAFPEAAIRHEPGCGAVDPIAGTSIEAAAGAADEADVAVAFVGEFSANPGMAIADADARDVMDETGGDAGSIEDPAAAGCRLPTALGPQRPTCGEGFDRASVDLPGDQTDLLRAVGATDTPLVVVFVGGRPYAEPWIADHADGLLHAWLPGEAGGAAIADVLGGADPGGRLPVTVPRSVGRLPVHYRRGPYATDGTYVEDGEDVLFPFGHGESYAEFDYGDCTAAPESVAPDGTVTLEVAVTNTADRPGTEVVQVYARDPVAAHSRPDRALCGFDRMMLDGGEERTVTIEIPAARLAGPTPEDPEPGRYELLVGRSVADVRAETAVYVSNND